MVTAQTPDLLEQEGDSGKGPMLSRLLALLDGGARLCLPATAPAWAQRIVPGGFAADAAARPAFETMLTWLEHEASGAEYASLLGEAAL